MHGLLQRHLFKNSKIEFESLLVVLVDLGNHVATPIIPSLLLLQLQHITRSGLVSVQTAQASVFWKHKVLGRRNN